MTNIVLFILVLQINLGGSLIFNYSTYMIPHPMKTRKGGEDAFFASRQLLVVADGVGGWNSKGIDPSLYSRFLCSAADVYFNEDPYHFTRLPQQLIVKAQQNNRHPGSSTMSVVTLEGQTLRSCHIGDCKLLVFRKYQQFRLIYESVDQLHGFNFPFQLAQDQYGGDSPYEAICSSLSIRVGDLLVLASDGMADNIFPAEMALMIEKVYPKGIHKGLARKLAKLASERSQKKQGISPFSEKAKQFGIQYSGGKIDDITVVVAEIIQIQKSNEVREL